MFGLRDGKSSSDQLLEKLIDIWNYFDENPALRKLSRYQRKLVLYERYLANELGYVVPANGSSLALLSVVPGEDFRKNARWKRRMREYRVNRILEDYGLTLDQFCAYPTFQIEEILAEQRQRLAEERKLSDAARRAAESPNEKPTYMFPNQPIKMP